MEFQLEKNQLRELRETDAEAIARHANNRKIWRNLRDRFPHPYSLEDAKLWIEITASEIPQTTFAIVVNGEVCGGIGLILGEDVYFRTAEIGYWLSEEHWGKGIISEAVAAVSEYGFEHLKLLRIWAQVFAWNPASMHVLEKCGFSNEGILRQAVFKDGEVIDAVRYALVR
jgi:[ribosomal protein S5]-alanine N-acetyltransferase